MKPAAEMTALEVLGYQGGKWPAHLTVQQMREQIAWEQHPDFEATTARIRAEMEANQAAYLAGWRAEKAAIKARRNEYEQRVEDAKELARSARAYYGRRRSGRRGARV